MDPISSLQLINNIKNYIRQQLSGTSAASDLNLNHLSAYPLLFQDLKDNTRNSSWYCLCQKSIKIYNMAELMDSDKASTIRAIVGFPPEMNIIQTNSFNNMVNLTYVNFKNIQEIHDNTFNGCPNIRVVDFSECAELPDFPGNNFMNDIDITNIQFIINTSMISKFTDPSGWGSKFSQASYKCILSNASLYLDNYMLESPETVRLHDEPVFGTDVVTGQRGQIVNENLTSGILYSNLSCEVLSVGSFGTLNPSLNAVILPKAKYFKAYGVSHADYCFAPELLTIWNQLFQFNTELQNVELYACNEIYSHGFEGCTSLKKIDINNVINIYTYAFGRCINLSSIEFENCRYIGDRGFMNCTSLTELTGGINVQTIGTEAFMGCKSLSVISFPSVESIGDNAFDGCSSIISAVFSRMDRDFIIANAYRWKLGYDTVSNRPFEVTVQAKARNGKPDIFVLNKDMPNAKTTLITIDGQRHFAYTTNNRLELDDDDMFVCRYNDGTEYTVDPCDVRIISSDMNCNVIEIPGRLTYESNGPLEAVSLPTVRKLGQSVFHANSNLTSAYLPNVNTVSYASFRRCSNLKYLNLANVNNLESAQQCFEGASVETLILSGETSKYSISSDMEFYIGNYISYLKLDSSHGCQIHCIDGIFTVP